MDRARDSGSEGGASSAAQPAAPAVKLTGRLRMPKAIPAHLQQHHNQQQFLLQQQQQQQQKLEAQYKSDATRDPSFSSQHDSGGDTSMVAMVMDGNSSSGAGGAVAQQPQQWHRDEHSRFIQALETYGHEQSGDEWTKITGFVQTRSIDEVRQHGRQYLQQLVQELSGTGRALQSIGSLGFTITPLVATAGGEDNKSHRDNQNDPNGQNYQVAALPSSNATGKPLKSVRSRAKSSGSSRGNSQSSKSLQQQQQNLMGVLEPSAFKTPQQGAPGARKSGGRKPKVWTFEEDKIFENALANWSSDKPYSWPKIATTLPGKTAKDARSRYEKLVGDIALIEKTEELMQLEPQAQAAPPRSGGLSSRISPPPPIQVPPVTAEEDKGIFHLCTKHLLVCLRETDFETGSLKFVASMWTRTFSVCLSPR